jgi:acetate kinase
LHNPANLEGIIIAEEIFLGRSKASSRFDTAFHQTIPQVANKFD